MKTKPALYILGTLVALVFLSTSATATEAEPQRAYLYGTKDIPEGISAEKYDPTQSPRMATKDITLEEYRSLDPRTFPHMVILEENWKTYMPYMQEYGKPPIDEIIADAKAGNPFAAAYLVHELGRSGNPKYNSTFSLLTYMFWMRVADSLTRPGWGEGVLAIEGEIRQMDLPFALMAIRGHSHGYGHSRKDRYRKGSAFDDPLSLYMGGAEYRAGTQGYASMLAKTGHALLNGDDHDNAQRWLTEACFRGDIDGCMKLSLFYEGWGCGASSKDLYKAYAVNALGEELSKTGVYWAMDVASLAGGAQSIYKTFTTPEQKTAADVAAAELLREYQEYRGKVLAEQRARREAVMPEILLQIQDWEKDYISRRR